MMYYYFHTFLFYFPYNTTITLESLKFKVILHLQHKEMILGMLMAIHLIKKEKLLNFFSGFNTSL